MEVSTFEDIRKLGFVKLDLSKVLDSRPQSLVCRFSDTILVVVLRVAYDLQ
jgi:hypothetical protein